MRNQGTRNDVATRSAKPSNGKCSSATRGSSRKKQGRLFRFSPRSKTIEIAQPLTAIYFRSTPRSTCNALFSPIFERRNQASSAFLTPSSLRELRLFPKLPTHCHPRVTYRATWFGPSPFIASSAPFVTNQLVATFRDATSGTLTSNQFMQDSRSTPKLFRKLLETFGKFLQ